MSLPYSKAPISELICGVIFNNNLLAQNSILFEVIAVLKEEYPIFQTQPPIFEEELQGYKIFQNINTGVAGFSLYRLISSDKKIIIQFQLNFILVNWVRNDDQRVGNYPGFSEIYNRFKKIFNLVEKKFSDYNPDIDIYRNIKTFTLHYQDRVFFNDYISDLSKIEEIVKLKTPVIKVLDNSSVSPNNIFSKFTVPINEINGYSIITVNTGTSMPANQQILIVECRIKGKFDGGKIDEWFNKAHDLQVKFFEDFFNKKILESWKQ